MTIPLKQSTAGQEVPLGYFLDSSDGDTEETGLTIANTDIKLWKAGATSLANKNSGGATHMSNGVYYAVLDATDTDTLGPLVIFVHVSGALAERVECVVYPANVYDSLIADSDTLDVNTIWISGDGAAANNLEKDYDGTGYSKGNSTIGTVTTVTDEVTADVTKISGSATAADNLEASALTIISGAAQAGTPSTTQMSTNLSETTDDHYNGRIIIWTSGNLTGQATDITDYDGSSALLTYTAVTEAPSAGDTFIII